MFPDSLQETPLIIIIPALQLFPGRYSEQKHYWGMATAVFAIAQAASGYGMSALYSALGSYHWLYLLDSILLFAGVGLLVFSRFLQRSTLADARYNHG